MHKINSRAGWSFFSSSSKSNNTCHHPFHMALYSDAFRFPACRFTGLRLPAGQVSGGTFPDGTVSAGAFSGGTEFLAGTVFCRNLLAASLRLPAPPLDWDIRWSSFLCFLRSQRPAVVITDPASRENPLVIAGIVEQPVSAAFTCSSPYLI